MDVCSFIHLFNNVSFHLQCTTGCGGTTMNKTRQKSWPVWGLCFCAEGRRATKFVTSVLFQWPWGWWRMKNQGIGMESGSFGCYLMAHRTVRGSESKGWVPRLPVGLRQAGKKSVLSVSSPTVRVRLWLLAEEVLGCFREHWVLGPFFTSGVGGTGPRGSVLSGRTRLTWISGGGRWGGGTQPALDLHFWKACSSTWQDWCEVERGQCPPVCIRKEIWMKWDSET